jgi:sec-independent protein translocase protein TatA
MTPLFAWAPSAFEIIFLLLIGVLLFGRRLPEVGRSLGKGIVEFKKGMRGLEDEIDGASHSAPVQRPEQPVEQIRPPQRVPTTAPKFEDNPNPIQPPPRP